MQQHTYFTDWPAALLHIEGSDRAKFLQNLCTADVLKMQSGAVSEAFFTTVKGHVIAHAVIACRDEAMEVIALVEDGAALAAHLDRYLLREEVRIELADARPVLVVGVDGDPPPATAVDFPLLDAPAWVILDGSVDTLPADYVVGDNEALAACRVASGWPLGGIDFQDAALPQELSRDRRAISFTKGCYLGQETVARLDALGRVNKQMVRVRAEGAMALAAGTELTSEGKTVGTITTAARLDDGYAGLTMVRRGSNAAGTRLDTEAGQVVVQSLDV